MGAWVETGVALFFVTVPFLCVWRWGWRGVVVGAAASWFMVAADFFAPSCDPEVAPLRADWLRYGWIVMLVYTGSLQLVMLACRRLREPAAAPIV